MLSWGLLFFALWATLCSLVYACTDTTTSLWDSILHDGNGAHQSAADHEATQQKLLGLMNSACNTDQRGYFALEMAYNNALFLDSMCYQQFYVTATTLTDVNLWLVCEDMALPLVLGISHAQGSFSDFDTLNQKCNYCSDALYPPVSLPVQITDPQHVRGIKTIKFILDWTNKLYNIQGYGLRKGIEAILEAIITKQVKKGVLDVLRNGTSTIIQTIITKGYTPPPSSGLLGRQATNATNSTQDEAFQYMNSSIEITATFQMLALEPNYTYAQLQQEIEDVLTSDNYTTLLQALNANVTEQHWSMAALAQISSGATASTGTKTASPTSSSTSSSTAVVTGKQNVAVRRGSDLQHVRWTILLSMFIVAAL